MSEQENKPGPSSCCRTLVESLSSENARLKAKNAQLEASFSEVLKVILLKFLVIMRLTQIIEGGNTVGLGHVYVDSHYYDDDDSEEDDYYDHDCHYNPKNKTRKCMGEDEIRTVLKLLNAGVKRVHFCVRTIKKIESNFQLHDFTKFEYEEDREDFEVEVEEGDWKIMIKIEEYGDHHDRHFSLKLEQKNRASKGLNSYSTNSFNLFRSGM